MGAIQRRRLTEVAGVVTGRITSPTPNFEEVDKKSVYERVYREEPPLREYPAPQSFTFNYRKDLPSEAEMELLVIPDFLRRLR